ncbi:hypothetical protein FPQ18DRAFT_322156 [Pyronema domesticum]|nr:hypothetical protein FPQ18DRAFT_322156 [Pyronema domesticum]
MVKFREIFRGPIANGDKRWIDFSPVTPLRAIIVSAIVLMVINASGWISLAVAEREDGWRHYYMTIDVFGMMYLFIGLVVIVWTYADMKLFSKGRLSPVYSICIASIFSAAWIVALAMALLFCIVFLSGWVDEEFVEHELRPGHIWRYKAVPFLQVLIHFVILGLYIWYLVLSVKVFRRLKEVKKHQDMRMREQENIV